MIRDHISATTRPQLPDLFPYEIEQILCALRRDMRHEQERAETDPDWAEFHRYNAHLDLQILESLNPKHSRSTK